MRMKILRYWYSRFKYTWRQTFAKTRMYSSRICTSHCRGTVVLDSPPRDRDSLICGQTDACENITFPQFHLKSVINLPFTTKQYRNDNIGVIRQFKINGVFPKLPINKLSKLDKKCDHWPKFWWEQNPGPRFISLMLYQIGH